MKVQPIALRGRPQQALLEQRLTMLVRPAANKLVGLLASGDRLWVREPFRLEAFYEHMSPTAADSCGAAPVFEADIASPADLATLGRQRFARELPRAWHRWHLVVGEIDSCELDEIDDAAALAAGFRDRAAFLIDWAQSAEFLFKREWAGTEPVLRIRVTPVLAPLPADKVAA